MFRKIIRPIDMAISPPPKEKISGELKALLERIRSENEALKKLIENLKERI